MAGKPTYEELEKRVLELEKADSKGKNVEAALKKRILALTQPTSDTGSLSFEDLFNLDDIQRLQDEFALATGVASIITNTDGTPITQPSNFCRLCKDIIRKTETGLINCYKSDAVLGRLTSKGPAIQRCMSGGLWDAGAGISIGGQHIANWLIGQVRDVTQTEDKLRLYAREIGANESETIAAFREVPSMSRERFEQVAQVLFTLANQLSTAAYQNVQQARFITERKLAEEDLRESEKLLKETQRVGKLGSWSLDVLTGYLRWSDESYRIFGFRPQEFIPTYEKFQSIIHPEDLDFVLEQVDAALNNDKHYDVDFRFVRPNEEIGWIHCEGEVTRDAQGKPLNFFGTQIDITDRKQAEKALQKKTHKLGERVKELNCLYAISALIEKPDISLPGICQGIVGIIPPSWQYPEITCSRIMLNGKVHKTDNFKETIWKQTSDIFVLKEQKGILEIYYLEEKPEIDEGPFLKEERSLINAIAERLGYTIELMQAAEALQESENKYRTLFETMIQGVVYQSADGQITSANLTAEQILGLTIEQMQGRTSTDPRWKAIHEDGNEFSGETHPAMIALRTGKEVKNTVMGVFHPDKEDHVWININAVPQFNSGSKTPYQVYSTFEDITNRRAMETRLQQAQKMEAIGALAGGVAHQFNNALSLITGNIDFLEMDYPGDEKIAGYTKQMKVSTHRMAQLSRQLLAYAEGGKYQVKIISVNDFVGNTLSNLHHVINPNIEILIDLAPGILNVKADQAQMQMLLATILTNATEAIEGEGFIRITTKGEEVDTAFAKHNSKLKTGQYARIIVEDNGKGMDNETRNRIFEPFFSTNFVGRGLGMASAFGIVRSHDGWISVYSEAGLGTTVNVYLPLMETQAEAPVKLNIKPMKSTGTILLIEDEEIIMEVNQELLERLGYKTIGALTGKEAINIAKTFDGEIDLAILDMILPDMDAKTIYSSIMEVRSDLKVLVCSGYSREGPAQEVIDAGAQDFIQKPFTMAELSEKLKILLGTEQ